MHALLQGTLVQGSLNLALLQGRCGPSAGQGGHLFRTGRALVQGKLGPYAGQAWFFCRAAGLLLLPMQS